MTYTAKQSRAIAVCQRRMWYRYWDGLRTIERLVADAKKLSRHESA